MSVEKIFQLEKEVAVINSKLDDIGKNLKTLTEWTLRHEHLHERMATEHEEIRSEIRSNHTEYRDRVGKLEREHTAFSSRQNVINAILGFLAGTAATIVATLLFG